jgi:cysteine desulfurase
VDAVQAVGRIPVDVRALGVDLLSVSGHKLGGPPGTGALFIRGDLRGDLRPRPVLTGGPQERSRRAGTENVLGAVGFGTAARLALGELAAEGPRNAALLGRLWEGIQRTVPDVRRNGPATDAVPNTLNVTFPGADADALVIGLDLRGISVSAGSACAAGALEPSHVLLAMGRAPAEARAALRVSTGYATTEADIDAVVAALPAVVEGSRRVCGRASA